MGIPFDEISAFIDCLRQIRNEGYDKNKLVQKFSHLDSYDKIIEEQERRKQKNCRNLKLSINSLEQKQIQLTNNIKELENKIIVLENYTNYLFLLLSNLKEIQILLKKMNVALENPKSILLYLFYISFLKDDEKDFKNDDDFSH